MGYLVFVKPKIGRAYVAVLCYVEISSIALFDDISPLCGSYVFFLVSCR